MLIVMSQSATPAQIQVVCDRVRSLGYTPNEIPGATRVAVAVTGNQGTVPAEAFLRLGGVAECVPISRSYKLAGREAKPDRTVIEVRGERIGDGTCQIIAGPCAVENRDQIFRAAEAVAKSGAGFLRGGAYKPRTSPYSFQGMRDEGLQLLDEVRREFGLRIVTELKDVATLDGVAEVADVIQIGTRNMQNFSMLEAVGRLRKPVLLKRGMSATLHELFMAAEYILAGGNSQVILCERGIRTFEHMTRNTFDISAIPMIHHHSHLPVAADPSHGVGIGWAVPAMARAAVVAGADAVMVEVHPDPDRALSDGQQALTMEEYARLAVELRELAEWAGGRA